jgi:diaminohydroxyphosphoribosylaminopyrimidine deaminase/5-amino-6-(5-phosphoribosylamino)uracil reductase
MPDTKDRHYMRLALRLAARGIGQASPNPAVGCIVVRNRTIVGKGWHRFVDRDHAEIVALRQAGTRARGGTAYVTLEPCSHHGRTPPCVDALIRAGVRRVVAAMIDPNPEVCGRGVECLRRAGVQVEVGIYGMEALKINEPFACYATTGRPLIVAKAGMSLDGRIATSAGETRWITSPEAREFGQGLRRDLDAILVGVGTVLADDPALTYRGVGAKDRPLVRVVLDSRLRTPAQARLFQDEAPLVIFCRPEPPSGPRRLLEKAGAEIIPVPSARGGLHLDPVIAELARRKILGLLVEGGSEIHWSFISRQLTDKFYFILAPLVLGGRQSVPSFGGKGFSAIASAPRFKITRNFPVGSDLVLEAYPEYSRSMASPWLAPETLPSGGRDSLPPSTRR